MWKIDMIKVYLFEKRSGRNQEFALEKSIEFALETLVEPTTSKKKQILEVIWTHEKINDQGNWNKIIIDDMFTFLVPHEIMHDDYEYRSITVCR